MFRLWQLVNPRGVLVAIGAFLFLLALLVHFLLLGNGGFDWLAQSNIGPSAGQDTAALGFNLTMHRGVLHVC